MAKSLPGSDWHGLNLKRALRILEHAGRPDPTLSADDASSQLQILIDDLCDLSIHDGLTGLVNARFFHASLEREIDRSYRTGRSCGLLLLDIDHFKVVNDTYGHPAGDFVLQVLARHLRHNMRGMDTAARIGGEEFAVILPECTPEDAIRAASRIHGAVNPLAVPMGALTITVTTSAGLVWTDPKISVTASMLLSQADQEMYRAKSSGRQTLCHPPVLVTEVSREERAALEFGLPEEEQDGP